MADILTPQLGESVSEATVARWTKKVGDAVKKDEVLVELETDKVSLEVASPEDGALGEILAAEGETVTPGARLGVVGKAGERPAAPPPQASSSAKSKSEGGKTATAAAASSSSVSTATPLPAPPAATSRGSVDVTVPVMGESVSEGTVARWSKKAGDAVKKDEVIVEIETDKVAIEVSAPADGVLSEIVAAEGATVKPGEVIARVGAAAGASSSPAPTQQPSGAGEQTPANQPPAAQKGPTPTNLPLSPSVQRIVSESGVDAAQIAGTGRDGRITKADALQAQRSAPVATAPAQAPQPAVVATPRPDQPREERVRMTRLRQTIARRLKEAQNTAAMLTTFNEVDMSAVMALRNQYKDVFEKRHGVKLGFMSFFTRAVVAALKEVPAVNAEIDGQDLVYKDHYDIGVAVGTDKGLVVPIVRDADQLSLAGIEKKIGELGRRARDGQLAIEDMQGGTFTITNGGIYGSLMSTPILNMPQAGILGMHNIVQRPVAVDGKVEIRPMMYLAVSYDHRIVDGKEAVTFLVAVKNAIEDPKRMLLDL